MRIYIMTDLEGVCGVMNFADWCRPESRYYEKAKELLTLEANAAVEGFLEAGATEITVADGHGPGAVDGTLLHKEACLLRGWPDRYPLLLDGEKHDAVAWVGQHPKSGAVGGHLSHTQGFAVRDISVNGVSVGEFGQFAMCATELGARAIFASGDEAFAAEAWELVPGIETVAVKRGSATTPGHHLPAKGYAGHNVAAVHLSPEVARARIRQGAQRALGRAKEEDFGLVDIRPPYERVIVMRSTETEGPSVCRVQHETSVAALFNLPHRPVPVEGADPMRMA